MGLDPTAFIAQNNKGDLGTGSNSAAINNLVGLVKQLVEVLVAVLNKLVEMVAKPAGNATSDAGAASSTSPSASSAPTGSTESTSATPGAATNTTQEVTSGTTSSTPSTSTTAETPSATTANTATSNVTDNSNVASEAPACGCQQSEAPAETKEKGFLDGLQEQVNSALAGAEKVFDTIIGLKGSMKKVAKKGKQAWNIVKDSGKKILKFLGNIATSFLPIPGLGAAGAAGKVMKGISKIF